MTMDEFLDSHPLPTNLKEVECQSTGRKFPFLHALNLITVKSEASLTHFRANSFWKLPGISNQLTRFLDNCLQELMWVRDRMLASKNMNADTKVIFWDKIDLKNKSHVIWLFDWCKQKPTILLNIIHGTIKQPRK